MRSKQQKASLAFFSSSLQIGRTRAGSVIFLFYYKVWTRERLKDRMKHVTAIRRSSCVFRFGERFVSQACRLPTMWIVR